jgi:hypothetical protein
MVHPVSAALHDPAAVTFGGRGAQLQVIRPGGANEKRSQCWISSTSFETQIVPPSRVLTGYGDRVHDPCHARGSLGDHLGRCALLPRTDLTVQIHHTTARLHAD